MLSKLWRTLTAAVKPAKSTGPSDGMLPRGKIYYMTFAIDDPAMAQAVRDWRGKRVTAEMAIDSYLQKLPSAATPGPIPYHTDAQGKVCRIGFAGRVPSGWSRDMGAENWLVPDERIERELARLPRRPSMAGLAAIIEWPLLPENTGSPADRFFAAHYNELPMVHEKDGRIFVDVPHPQNFKQWPDLAKALWSWDAPAGMTRVGVRRGPSPAP